MDSSSCCLNCHSRVFSSAKSTWWPSNSGPSTQANRVLPPTVQRHAPHMPMPSTMMELSETVVLVPNGRVTRHTASIMGTGPMATTSAISSSVSRMSCRTSVTNPLWPSEPSSVAMRSSGQNEESSEQNRSRFLDRAPMMAMTRLPASTWPLAMWCMAAMPVPPPTQTTVPDFSMCVGLAQRAAHVHELDRPRLQLVHLGGGLSHHQVDDGDGAVFRVAIGNGQGDAFAVSRLTAAA